jgi:capsular polysaccharide transport system permease protein
MAEFPYFRRNRGFATVATAEAGARQRPNIADTFKRMLDLINIWFWALVGVPTILAAIYFFGIASSQYLSKVEFVVRAPNKASLSSISSLLSGTASTPGIEDTYAVADFIMSRDAVRRLEAEAQLRSVLSAHGADFLSRFPGLLSVGRSDFEALFKAYSRFVTVDIDSQSGIATLEVKAYRAEDAQRVAQALLAYSEELVNAMNERSRQDALKTFKREVDAAKEQIQSVQTRLTSYRMQQNILDPKSAAAGPLELVAKLTAQQAAAQTQLADLMRNSPHSPQLPLIKTRIASLSQSIADARAKITGSENSVASVQSEYERLTVELGLDEKALGSAFTSLEAARLEAQRQQLYLETVVQPNLPDYPIYPKRMVSFLVVTASCLLVYGIVWLLVASVREHASA